ncbi:MAG: TRAP transporter small permease subunit [Proteobacteria bacterium]|nr:TRAP transporter small permease subunit [Pseudomonadota bacterium]
MIEQGATIKLIKLIGATNTWVARVVCGLTIIMTATICYEVVCRYFLNAPTDWSNELNQYLLCGMSMLGGGYCLLQDQHVRVDVMYMRFSARRRAIVELCTWWLLILFCLVMAVWGGELALDSLIKDKRSMSILEMPLFPSMAMVPLGAFLVLMQGVARILSNILILKAGKAREAEIVAALKTGKSLFE